MTDVAWDFIPSTRDLLELARSADAICFGSLAQRSEPSRQTIHALLSESRADAIKIFDVNIRQQFHSKEIIQQSLHLANTLKVSEEELPTLLSALDIHHEGEDALKLIIEEYSLEAIALTMGAKGSVIISGGEVSRHSGFPAKVVDTVGAGDSFTAALATGLLNGFSLDEINEKANRLASFVCGQSGGTPTIPSSIAQLFIEN